VGDGGEVFGGVLDFAEDVDGAGGTGFAGDTGRGGAPENAEGLSGRPIGQRADLQLRVGILCSVHLHGDSEVEFVAPAVHHAREGQRLPNRLGGFAVVQGRFLDDLVGSDPNRFHGRILAERPEPHNRMTQLTRGKGISNGGVT